MESDYGPSSDSEAFYDYNTEGYDDPPYSIPPVNDEGYTLTEEEARADEREDD